MTRSLHVAAAQMGPIPRAESKTQTVSRLIALLEEGASRGVEVVVFPELALSTYFPRWWMDDDADIDSFFEAQMPSEETQPLFDRARELSVGFYLGYAELDTSGPTPRRYNTSVFVGPDGTIGAKYRKVHLPGHEDHKKDWGNLQQLEKKYFEPGDLGFPVFRAYDGILGMAICNDRRWPETYRVMGMQGVELIMIGYNTPVHTPGLPQHNHLQGFWNHLSMQAGAYQNGSYVVGAAKCGHEEGGDLIGQSAIIAPTGEMMAQAVSLEDELISAVIDLDRCEEIKGWIFNFEKHRQPQHYSIITESAGVQLPPE
ncbi:N-carbamoyl-D-amino-acid hydrolase [Nesterenkonia alba]|uniref:N-carbamoyl-D-amino-acid hydrolase n=1 Tax=Nesterenkonia alba TaxID=515814 RepID=UPI0003B3C9C0|nr:N-carbamoyl-D-amino-acid hydrolase [Nesterenkonia alba]